MKLWSQPFSIFFVNFCIVNLLCPIDLFLFCRYPSHHEVHGGKNSKLAPVPQPKTSCLKHRLCFPRPFRCEPKHFQKPKARVGQEVTQPVELKPLRERIPGRKQREHPGLSALLCAVIVINQVALFQQLETGLLQRLQTDGSVANVWQSIPFLDLLFDPAMLCVFRVIFVGHAPLIASEDGTRLEHAVDLPIALDTIGGVACGLDGVGAVERRVLERHFHEIALD
mmetsp:Transcript_905/g.1834  ORF Transcript_905/g.1834 Transcript_905/m.1834 type:complete len:225 (+) Transcript_905:256-930(+)